MSQSCQLPADCLNEIFEYLEEDKISLRSCLLVNRLWCEVAVRILWRNVWNFHYSLQYNPYREHVPLAIISTLFICLPNESKEFLNNRGIFITTPTSKPPLFNYASFCKVLSISEIDKMVKHVVKSHIFRNNNNNNNNQQQQQQQQIYHKKNLDYNKYFILQEILKMFMNEISSLKFLDYDSGHSKNVTFTCLPGAKNCLKDLSELRCCSDIYSEFFFQLSQICHNIQSLIIEFNNLISNGLSDLISTQNNLKNLTLRYYEIENENHSNENGKIINSLDKSSETLITLKLDESYIPLSFIKIFKNLRELSLSLETTGFGDFIKLQNKFFPKLKILKFLYEYPKIDLLIKFLEINGKNLEEFYIEENNHLLNLSISKFCPNLRSLYTLFKNDEIDSLKLILNSCQYLESINIRVGEDFLNEKDFFNMISNYSPKNFYELKIYYDYTVTSNLLPEELEEFFINWNNRLSKKSLLLNIIKGFGCISLEVNVENMKIIEKYKKLGIVKILY